MPTVAAFNGIKIELYFDEHPPPHFHARYAEFVAQIDMGDVGDQKRKLAETAISDGSGMGLAPDGGITGGLGGLPCWRQSRENRMNDIPRITSAEVVIHGILKIEWNDGYVGVVDLWPVISRGKIFEYLQNAESFQNFQVGEYGHALVWTNEKGEEIDFGAGSLRQRAEKQSELHRQAG